MIMQTRTHVAVGAVGVSAIVIALLYTHVVPLNVTRTVKVKFVIDKEYESRISLKNGTSNMRGN